VGAAVGKMPRVHPSTRKFREGCPSEKSQGLRYSHHTPNHKKILLETPCNDSPPTRNSLSGACPRVSGRSGGPGVVEPEIVRILAESSGLRWHGKPTVTESQNVRGWKGPLGII